MKLNYFSIIGYVSVVLWLVVPVLWVLHAKLRPRRWLCHIALAVALLAYIFALLNSKLYVNRIQLDQSAEIAAVQAAQEEARKAAENIRGGEVAQIKFAEDSAGAFMDAGGMDASDLKTMAKLKEKAEPEWKKNKKKRAESGKQDDSIDDLIGGKTANKAAKSASPADAAEPAQERQVFMLEGDRAMANRLDGANLKLIRLLLLLAVLIVVVDYLRRANIYKEAYMPLPMPSSWLNEFSPVPTLMIRPEPARRTMPEELAWLVKRGDSFAYMTDDSAAAGQVSSSLPRFGKRHSPVDVIRVTTGDGDISDEFVFEALWYGRSSFVVDSADRASQMLNRFMDMMAARKARHAKVAQTVHIIWDCSVPLDESWQAEFVKLAKATGMSLVIAGGGSRK